MTAGKIDEVKVLGRPLQPIQVPHVMSATGGGDDAARRRWIPGGEWVMRPVRGGRQVCVHRVTTWQLSLCLPRVVAVVVPGLVSGMVVGFGVVVTSSQYWQLQPSGASGSERVS